MATIRLTMAQALVRYLAAQRTECDGRTVPLFGGVWAIFGHGNVAGIGEALAAHRDDLPTYRAHNEQAMAQAAIGYAKAMHRRRMMACTTSIGPGATNMVTAAAVAHVNRLPVLLLPGDVFAIRRPDPVLQQVERFRRRHGIGERLLPPGLALLRPHHAARADPHGAAARAVGADRSGRMRPGDAGAVPGRAGRGVRLSRTASSPTRLWHVAPAAAGRRRTGGSGGSAAQRQGAADHRRRRRALLGGDRDARPLRHRARHPGGETQAGKSALPHDHPLQSRRDRRHRHVGGERRPREAADVDPRRRHAAAGFHHRLVGAVPEPRAPADRPQRAAVRCRQAPHAAAGRRCTRGLAELDTALGRPPRAGCLAATPDRRRTARGASRPPRSPRHPTPNCRRTRR